VYKNKGNEAFKGKNFEEAIKQYNKAIQLDPTNAAYYSNRSGAWSSKGNHESALADANRCLDRDPNFLKGYGRKGNALFHLGRLDEAEDAYKAGLAIDSSYELGSSGLADIRAERVRRSKSSSFFSGGMGGILSKIGDTFKKGKQMQMIVMFSAMYYLLSGRFFGGSSSASKTSSGRSAGDDTAFEWGREFMDVKGSWISYLETVSEADTTLLLLHRTSSSAQGDYTNFDSDVAREMGSTGLRLIAPDRPCHGYSPCPAGGEGNASKWLSNFLAAKKPAPKQLAIAAIGRDSARQAFALARQRAVLQIWLLSPRLQPPPPRNITEATELSAWINEHLSAAPPRVAIAAAQWATAVGSFFKGPQKKSKPLDVSGLPADSKVTIVLDGGEEDDELTLALEEQGVEVATRHAEDESILGVLLDEIRQAYGASGAEAESVSAEEPQDDVEEDPEEEPEED